MRECEKEVKNRLQAGYSLGELLVATALLAVLLAGLGRILRDSMLTSKTLVNYAEANTEMVRLIRNITLTFQRTLPVEKDGVKVTKARGCVLQKTDPNEDDRSIDNYECINAIGGTAPSDGIGFGLDADNKPSVAFVNVCEAIPDAMVYPAGRLVLNVPPKSINSNSSWGNLSNVCPAECGDGTRPAILFLREDNEGSQIPRKISSANDTSALNLWGAVLCASYFRDDLRYYQNLYADNVGGFLPFYLNLSVFVAHAKFDVLPVSKTDSAYFWTSGGTTLEFSANQELNVFRCNPDPNDLEYGCQ